jgi:hypothetical protein
MLREVVAFLHGGAARDIGFLPLSIGPWAGSGKETGRNTEFGVVAGTPIDGGRAAEMAQEPREVARAGLRAVVAGKHSVVPGFKSWLGVECQRILPRRFVSGAAEMLLRPKHLG